VLTLQGAFPKEKDFEQTPCADIDGFFPKATPKVQS
jgi:hypothetical protein